MTKTSIKSLQKQIEELEHELDGMRQSMRMYYASKHALHSLFLPGEEKIPEKGSSGDHIIEFIKQEMALDFKPTLNTASYVNVVHEKEEMELVTLGLSVNLADSSIYPNTTKMHDNVVKMVARLFHIGNNDHESASSFSGTGTVGSTEACLLAGLAFKFRWRKWYANKFQMTDEAVLAVRPNLVISSCYQAAWEKMFRFFDVEPRIVKPSKNKFTIAAKDVVMACDEKTIGVVGIMGNHYQGAYDPIQEIDSALDTLNKEKDYQIGIHVDAASGGFIAPFQDNVPAWDFRLSNVLSINASGHKFGDAACGTGWLVFRRHDDLAEHVAVSVDYLGSSCDSMSLNFSRPAIGTLTQLYKFIRYGEDGYRQRTANQMEIASHIRSGLCAMKYRGVDRFVILDASEQGSCLPVVAACLNPALGLKYTDIDLQHALSESHWYVCGYHLCFENYKGGNHKDKVKLESIFQEEEEEEEEKKVGDTDDNTGHHDLGKTRSLTTMFRIVVKSNLTISLADHLLDAMKHTLSHLDKVASEMEEERQRKGREKEKSSTRTFVKPHLHSILNPHKHHKKRKTKHMVC